MNKIVVFIFLILMVLGLTVILIPYKNEKKNKAFETMALTLLDASNDVKVEYLEEKDEQIENQPEIVEENNEQIDDEEKPSKNSQSTSNKESYIGVLKIPKIKLEKGFYDKNSKNNTVDKNVMILSKSSYPDEELGNVMLAGHNGTSYRAYFKRLSDLKIGDVAYIKYNNVEYKYELVNVYTQPKTGNLIIYRNNSKTVLTLITCTKNSNTLQSIYIFERI